MKQLSGLDASFLYMETANQFGHVSSVSVYERPDQPGWQPFESWRDAIERRLSRLEPLTRKLVDAPLRLDHPFWVQDPDFDLDFHVRHTAVAPPGTDEQLAALVARIIGRPLDRSRPLWESYVIEGLPDNRFAILTKVHHATIDGASGAELLTMMLDESPEASMEDGDPLPAARPPSQLELTARTTIGLARKPARMLVLSARTMRDLGAATRNPVLQAAGEQLRSSLRGPLGTLLNLGRPRPAERDTLPLRLPSLNPPRTVFNRPITPHRSFAFRSTNLEAVKAVKNALGATVNDVVMAACAGGLRAWLEKKGELPEKPLVAMIPVSVRTDTDPEKWTNRVSAIFSNIPTDEPDPLQRVLKVHEAMMTGKGLFDALPAERLIDFAAFPPPAVFTRASRLATRLGARVVQPPVNLVISNVPGPRNPLWSAGARLLHYYPVSTIVDGQGLNITVQSYLDTLDFGLVGCAELVPDIWDLAEAIVADLEGLVEAAGVDTEVRRSA